MPPLQTPGTAYTNPKNVAMRRTPTGRMHAAPTDRPGTAGEWVKQVFTACRPRRGQDPALQTGGNGQRTGNPARRAPLPGGIYASPTNTRYRVHKPQKRCHAANAHGPHACGPYRPAGNSRRMGKAGVYRVPSTAGSRPRPTNRGKRATNREPRAARTPAGRHICLPYKQGNRVHEPKNGATGQTSTGRIHTAPTDRPGTTNKQVKQKSAADVRAGDGRCNGAACTVVYRTGAFCTGRGFAPR